MLETAAPSPTDLPESGATTEVAWSTPDFTVVDTGMEVTAYYLNDL